MLVFNCTKAAAEFFTVIRKGAKISQVQAAPEKTIAGALQAAKAIETDKTNRQWHWLVHAIKVKRKNVLIVMDYESRFAMTFTGLKKGDELAFIDLFEQHLNHHIQELMPLVITDPRFIDNSFEQYFHQHSGHTFYQRGDRSVQSHINDVTWHIEVTADEMNELPVGIDLIAFDCYINSTIRNRKGGKGYFIPQQAFLHQWLCQYGGLSREQADQHITALQAQEQARYQAMHNSMFDVLADDICDDIEDLFPGQTEPRHYVDNVIRVDFTRKKH